LKNCDVRLSLHGFKLDMYMSNVRCSLQVSFDVQFKSHCFTYMQAKDSMFINMLILPLNLRYTVQAAYLRQQIIRVSIKNGNAGVFYVIVCYLTCPIHYLAFMTPAQIVWSRTASANSMCQQSIVQAAAYAGKQFEQSC
jgi:hypothetical protein